MSTDSSPRPPGAFQEFLAENQLLVFLVIGFAAYYFATKPAPAPPPNEIVIPIPRVPEVPPAPKCPNNRCPLLPKSAWFSDKGCAHTLEIPRVPAPR